jgi:hypothetical protein
MESATNLGVGPAVQRIDRVVHEIGCLRIGELKFV